MQTRRIAAPAYLVAFLLVLFPSLDYILSVWPPRAGQVAWRFGAAGVFSRALLTPLIGVLIAFAVALILDHRRVLRGLAILSGVAALALIAVVGLFMLDAVEMRARAAAADTRALSVVSIVALAKYFFGILVTLVFAIVGWKASRREAPTKRGRAKERRMEAGLVVAHPVVPPEAPVDIPLINEIPEPDQDPEPSLFNPEEGKSEF